ncbi:MAG: hypothetical protein R6V35_00560 [Candidatus Nanohaloarchaea archaeon]
MTEYTFDKTKGQSAIEYLMTYGWMLLVVAIVGGAIFATVQGQCTQSTSGFSGGDVLIDNFGTDSDGNLQMEVRNGGSNTLDIDSVNLAGEEFTEGASDNDRELVFDEDGSIGVGSAQTVTLGNSTDSDNGAPFGSSDGCNDYDIEFNYGFDGGLDDQVTSGTLTDSIEFDN